MHNASTIERRLDMKIECRKKRIEEYTLIPEEHDLKSGSIPFAMIATLDYDAKTIELSHSGTIRLFAKIDSNDFEKAISSLDINSALSLLSQKRIFDIENSKLRTLRKIKDAHVVDDENYAKLYKTIDAIETFDPDTFACRVQHYLNKRNLDSNSIEVVYKYPTIEKQMVEMFVVNVVEKIIANASFE